MCMPVCSLYTCVCVPYIGCLSIYTSQLNNYSPVDVGLHHLRCIGLVESLPLHLHYRTQVPIPRQPQAYLAPRHTGTSRFGEKGEGQTVHEVMMGAILTGNVE